MGTEGINSCTAALMTEEDDDDDDDDDVGEAVEEVVPAVVVNHSDKKPSRSWTYPLRRPWATEYCTLLTKPFMAQMMCWSLATCNRERSAAGVGLPDGVSITEMEFDADNDTAAAVVAEVVDGLLLLW